MTETKQEGILRKVRALVAKANSTEHDAERQVFMAKADQLMEAYAIQEWMLKTDEKDASKIVKREIDMSWWTQLRDLHVDARWSIWYLFLSCVEHCRCYTTWSAHTIQYKDGGNKIAVFGMEADLSYLDLLFTDLLVQLFAKLKPAYTPDESLGYNMYVAKEAGMSWETAARWAGMPELIREREVYNARAGRYEWKTEVDGKLVREYKKFLAEKGLERIVEHPHRWQISFCEGFYYTISQRLNEMKEGREQANTNSMALALRDIRQQAQEAMWDEFPELRPHPEDCECEQCSAKKKPVKYRDGFKTSYTALSRGGTAGKDARIASRGGGGLKSRRQIES